MIFGMNTRTINVCVLALLCLPGVAMGQDGRGASVGAGVSATNMDSRTDRSFSGAFGYRFTKVVGLEIETTVVPKLRSEFPGVAIQSLATSPAGIQIYPQIYPGPTFANPDGRAVIFSNNVRVTIPTTSTRLEPFFVVGGGIASVRHEGDFIYSIPPIIPVPVIGIPSLPTLPTRIQTQHLKSSSVAMALTLGGGLGVRVASQLWIDADLRLFRILGDEDQNVGRFGVGVRYRF
jgi:opacity protein-like surface antigen